MYIHLSIFIILLLAMLVLGQKKVMRAEQFNLKKKNENDTLLNNNVQ